MHCDKVGFISRIQSWLNIRKPIPIIHCINKGEKYDNFNNYRKTYEKG